MRYRTEYSGEAPEPRTAWTWFAIAPTAATFLGLMLVTRYPMSVMIAYVPLALIVVALWFIWKRHTAKVLEVERAADRVRRRLEPEPQGKGLLPTRASVVMMVLVNIALMLAAWPDIARDFRTKALAKLIVQEAELASSMAGTTADSAKTAQLKETRGQIVSLLHSGVFMRGGLLRAAREKLPERIPSLRASLAKHGDTGCHESELLKAYSHLSAAAWRQLVIQEYNTRESAEFPHKEVLQLRQDILSLYAVLEPTSAPCWTPMEQRILTARFEVFEDNRHDLGEQMAQCYRSALDRSR